MVGIVDWLSVLGVESRFCQWPQGICLYGGRIIQQVIVEVLAASDA